jgi:hypothetical protein
MAVVLGFGLRAGIARADGDPASDVLATQSLFLPQDAAPAAAGQAQLSELLHEAAASGLPIRVAVIASSSDLGSVTALWRQPQNYARFLAAELDLVYRGPLLVVMPEGYGLAGDPSARSALAGLPAPAHDLVAATLAAVVRVARAGGHRLVVPGGAPAARGAASDVTPWLVFAAGWVVVLLAWGASLRARPPSFRARTGAT